MTELISTTGPKSLTLSNGARRYVRRALAPSTIRAYRAAWREFENYARGSGKTALPASPATVADYLADLADRGAKVSTIEVKLAAVTWAHRAAGADDPTLHKAVKATMAGIRRKLKRAPAKKEPATLAEIAAMVATLPATAKGKRDKALLLVGFAGAFRRSELVALDVAAIRISDARIKILVRKSKTDQTGEGHTKTVPAIGGNICPVAALRDWLDVADIRSGPVFRQVDRHGNVRAKRLTSQSVALIVKAAARAAGLDWRAFSGHSLRSGFVTEAMNRGATDSDIVEQTGHRSLATMRGYRKNTGVGASRAVLAAFNE